MNELIVVEKIAEWQKLKSPVLDFLAHHAQGVQHGVGRVYDLVQAGTTARLQQSDR